MRSFMRIIFILTIFSLVVFSCNNSGSSKKNAADTTQAADSVRLKAIQDSVNAVRDSILLLQAKEVLTLFKTKKYDSLAMLVHPDEGVRFSPYGYIDTANDKIFRAEAIKSWTDRKKQLKIYWGSFDAGEKEIRMTADQYMKRFVYDVDFIKPDSIATNGFIGGGNSMNNLLAVYPDCFFVESYFKGFDKKYDGMDWRSLRLVFKLKDGKYYLVAVVHDEWTI